MALRALLRSAERVRRRAYITLLRDLNGLDAISLPPPAVERATRYSQRARLRWLDSARSASADGATSRQARRFAATRTQGYLDLVAETEAARAYNEDRAEYASRYARTTGEVVLLEWDAYLDRRTCSRCEDLDGTQVLATEGWDVGPGAIHPRCRCISNIITERRAFAA